MPEQAEVQFGREICGDLVAAESREWLVTNGIGGYASGTVAGSQTRRYHGVLIAALQPPVGRTQLVSTIDEIVHYAGADFSLATHRWASGAVDPQGFLLLEDFHLEGSTPVWTYALADALLEKRVWMRQGENTTFIQYTLVRGSAALEMELKALVNYRDFHSLTHAGDWRMHIEPVEHGVKVLALDGARPFYLKSSTATCQPRHDWYLGCFLGEETARGLDDREDRLFAALFRAKLEAGSSITLVATTEAAASLDIETARAERPNYEVKLFHDWQAKNEALVEEAPTWLWQLILAADQFIVKRSLPEEPDGRSIIAGYHWFGDWGRDTMIALPGLTLATGRTSVARQILLAFSRYVDGGMLPNNFPDVGGQPEYNTVDAALRPNQILAVSLPVSPLTSEQQKAVVDVCARHLLTSHGLRSLAPGEAGYAGHYGGSPRDRDAAYHQGTVWGWLLGPFALAHYRIYRDREAALRFLEPLGRQIYASGLGTLSEIFDGDAPFTPRGCIAQAWTVAEVLRAWKEIMGGKKPDSVRSI